MEQSNIAVKDGKITYIGEEQPAAKEVLDVKGDIVSPGFIDIHMHEEDFLGEGKEYVIANMMLQMGVTTAVGGNCGVQHQPISTFRQMIEELGGSPINYLMLAGYNEFRGQLGIGHREHATQEQMTALREKMKQELADGAYGISFGIEYDPGITYEEMAFAVKASDDSNHLMAAHYRADCIEDIASVEEMVRLSSEIPQKFQISHLSSCSAICKMKESLACINAAMEKNPKLNYDTYPYHAFSTTIGSEVFADGCLEAWKKDYDSILLTDEPYKNIYCTEELFKKVRKEYPEMLAVAFVMNEEEIAAAIANPNGMVASDAIINHGNGHPRAAGTFPRVLGKYVREDQVLPMIDALRKMTLEPAKRLDLAEKGRIEIGCDADLTIFNPDTIIDRADFTSLNKPEGIDYVLIGGQVAAKDCEIINGRLGKFIPYQG
ncbi:MAG: amidohydrolase family protein [Firmicutes bacterium]|nr:amidohydrolase family protein [Bacillota bacterium]